MSLKFIKQIVLFLLIVFHCAAFGQNQTGYEGKVDGNIVDKTNGESLEYVTVVLYSLPDSSLISGAISDEHGAFKITGIPNGTYYMKASFIGFKPKIISPITISDTKPYFQIPEITLQENTEILNEVTVSGERSAISYQIDKKVISASKDIAADGGTALELLSTVPSIQTNMDGEVTLKGSSDFTVFINGKPSALDANDALNSIPASAIEKIEIISNPSVKYNPEGVSGIINIVTKHSANDGLNGMIDGSVGNIGQYSGNVLLEYNKNKIRGFGGFSLNSRPSISTRETNNIYMVGLDSVFNSIQLSDHERNRKGFAFNGGISYVYKPKSLISLSANIGNRAYNRAFETKVYEHNTYNTNEEYSLQNTAFSISNTYYKILANISHQFKKEKHMLAFGVDIYDRQTTSDDTFSMETTDNNWNSVSAPITGDETREASKRFVSTANLDYTNPLTKNLQLETGLYNEITRFDTDYKGFTRDSISDNMLEVDSLAGNYYMHRNIYAAYLLLTYETKKLGIKAGLRGEYTNREIENSAVQKVYIVDLFNVYPSVHFSYDLEKKRTIQFSYSKKIKRPRHYYLNPVTVNYEATNIRIGNPDLKPENTHSFELNFQKQFKKNSFITELYYRHTTDIIERVSSIDEQNRFVYTYSNIDSDNALGIESVIDFSPLTWWNFFTSVNVYYYSIQNVESTTTVSNSNISWNFKFNNTFKLKTNTKIQISAQYNSKEITSQSTRKGYYSADAGISQQFFKKRLTVTVNARDILNSRVYSSRTTGKDYVQYSVNDFTAPIVQVSVSYKINNYNKKQTRKSIEDGDDE